MTEYRATIKRRIAILAVCMACAAVFVATAGIWSYRQSIGSEEHMRDFTTGMSTGMFCAMVAASLMNIMKYRAALKDEAKLKAMYIQEHDERWLMIQSKTGGFAYQFAMGVIMIAGVSMSFIREQAGFALLIAAAFMAVLKLALRAYYNRKF